ncbi:hypothetical protein ACH5RR_027045 [Cinchona calisaya]|uniref:Reverse transcriptase zinc-binding domain-containing protein n=1 Tax=Cinchona calisaya TaxID=153742 RepID=A0ABD2Z5B6_9GENT
MQQQYGLEGLEKLCKLDIKCKLKHIIWNCLSQAIPNNEEMHRTTRLGNPWCKICGEDVQTLEHIIFFCLFAQMVWKMVPIKWDEIEDLRYNIKRWRLGLMEAGKMEDGNKQIGFIVKLL